jgi:DNA-binding TFAR19-related protein (PDSD5 family)
MVSESGSESTSNSGASEDADLKMLNARRMVELRRRINSNTAKKVQSEKPQEKLPTDREVLMKALTDRGDEVIASAEASYPREMKILIPKFAQLIREGKVTTITGGDLLQFFRSMGMRVSVKTSISVEDHGKFMSIAEKMKRDE